MCIASLESILFGDVLVLFAHVKDMSCPYSKI